MLLSITYAGDYFYVVELDDPKIFEDAVPEERAMVTAREYEPFNRILDSFRVP